MIDKGYVVKDTKKNEYWCGYNQWDTQLRKAKIFHWHRYAEATVADKRFKTKEMVIIPVEIKEIEK